MTVDKNSRIIIVGSGVFGLSSALHLVENGYTNVTIFDRLDLLKLKYHFDNGADTASADINKVFRASYADKDYYHRLALKAKDLFLKWDYDIKTNINDEEKQNYGVLKIIDNCGLIRLDDTAENSVDEVNNLNSFTKSGLRHTQFDINNIEDIERAKNENWDGKLNPLGIEKGKIFQNLSGVLDSTSGLIYAANACVYVNLLLRRKGVNFITGGEKGKVKKLILNSNDDVDGILTEDGKEHLADLTILAAGPWSSSLLPELSGLSEAHTGNVILIKIPENRKNLREKYSSKNFPIINWRVGYNRERDNFSGFGVFPLSEPDGYIKIITRQKKFGNPVKLDDGTIVSLPLTSRSEPPETRLSKDLIIQVKDFIKIMLPDLIEFGITKTILLWYTDTINNDFIVDYNPNKRKLLVVTGGSGHGFKFLPVLGQFVVDVIEGRRNEYTEHFKWRDPSKFSDVNKIGDIKTGKSSYYNQELNAEIDLKFTKEDLEKKVKI